MSKERLEEIKSRVWKDRGTYAMGDENHREGYIYTLSDYDYEWLIEQAERVQELEKDVSEWKIVNEQWEKINTSLVEQNKRYKELLNKVAYEDIDFKQTINLVREYLECEE